MFYPCLLSISCKRFCHSVCCHIFWCKYFNVEMGYFRIRILKFLHQNKSCPTLSNAILKSVTNVFDLVAFFLGYKTLLLAYI